MEKPLVVTSFSGDTVKSHNFSILLRSFWNKAIVHVGGSALLLEKVREQILVCCAVHVRMSAGVSSMNSVLSLFVAINSNGNSTEVVPVVVWLVVSKGISNEVTWYSENDASVEETIMSNLIYKWESV